MAAPSPPRRVARALVVVGAVLLGLALYALVNPACRSQPCQYVDIPCQCPTAPAFLLALGLAVPGASALVASLVLSLLARTR